MKKTVITIAYGQNCDYTKLFTSVLSAYYEEVNKKERKGTNTITPNFVKVGKGKGQKIYTSIGGGFDCETSKVLSDEYKNSIAFPYVMQLSLGKHVILDHNCDKAYEFYKGLSEAFRLLYPKATLLLFDANLGYEYSFFRYYLRSAITSVFAKTTRQILKVSLFDNIVIQEVIGLFGRSLAKIAETYTETQKLKGDLDYNLVRLPITSMKKKEKDYDVNDVVILSELYDYVFNSFFKKGKKLPLTSTGFVRNNLKERAGQKLKFITQENQKYLEDRTQYDLDRTYLYKGGLTHSMYDHKGNKKGHTICVDLTSAYPWTYSTQYFPCGDIIRINADKKETVIKALKKYKHWKADVYIKSMKSKTGHSIESIHKIRRTEATHMIVDNGRIMEASDIILRVNEIDYKSLLLNYDVKLRFKSLEVFTQSKKCPDFIRREVLTDYTLKSKIKVKRKAVEKLQKSTTDADELNELSIQLKNLNIEYNESKERVNSIYGCTGTEVKLDTFEVDNTTGSLKAGEQKTWEEGRKTVFLNPYLAYWCTSRVRYRLIYVISKFPEDVYQYDTDSLYVNADNKELMALIDEINEEIRQEATREIPEQEFELCRDLGQWDNDGEYEFFIPLGSKRYLGIHFEEETNELFKNKNTPSNKEAYRFTYNDMYENLTDEVIEKALYFECKYKLTFAGARKTDVFMYCAYNNINVEDFVVNMDLLSDVSTKLSAEYFDEARSMKVTDYEGNTMLIIWASGQILNNASFSAHLDKSLSERTGIKDVKRKQA